MDIHKLKECVRDNVGDLTFAESFALTGRVLNIAVASANQAEPHRLLNYLTSPDVLVRSAACASCALPGLFEPVTLMAKRKGNIVPYHPSSLQWADGSIEQDLPMRRVAELFNVNHFIVSQVNPHVIPFLPSENVVKTSRSIFSKLFSATRYLLLTEARHRLRQLAHFFVAPRVLANIFANQKYTAEINIVPALTLTDYEQILKNPNQERLLHCIKVGQTATFYKLMHIKNNLAIEQTLAQCEERARMNVESHDKTTMPHY